MQLSIEPHAAFPAVPFSPRILLVDDHAMVREGMKMRLALEPGLQVIGDAEDAESALTRFAGGDCSVRPNVVVTDISLPGMNGIELTKVLRLLYPDIVVIVVSMHDDANCIRHAIRAGARGYVLKDAPSDELLAAIRTALTGRVYLSERVLSRMASPDENPMHSLTPREREVLSGIGRGLANKEMAAQIGVSVRTVETHRLNLKRKLGIDGRAHLVRYAVDQLDGKTGVPTVPATRALQAAV